MQNATALNPNDTVKLFEIANILGVVNTNFKVISTHPGGMGICYKLQSKENQKNYGLKCIRPDLIGPDNLNRFYDEINVWITASACDGIAEAISVIRFNEMPAILSPWYEKGDLSNWISKLKPPYDFEVLIRTIRTLSWAYSKLGIIHRDLKPDNILLDDRYLSYLSDWGLARPLSNLIKKTESQTSNGIIERPDRTQPGMIMGTALYISPEQIRNPQKVDHRSDIYSLGCIMYEMETGVPPFLGKNPYEIIYKHLNEPAPRLGGPLKKTKLSLENVIEKCLSKSPDQRYASYKGLENDLISIADKKSFSLARCQISERYKRYPLGKGQKIFKNIRKEANVKSEDRRYGLLELEEIKPFLIESEHLLALGHYSEAEKLLRPLIIPDMLQGNGPWHFGHVLALNYAFCLTNIQNRNEESLKIFQQLNNKHGKPPEFYVNYTLALLRSGNYSHSEKICLEGLGQYPSDYDLLGNYTLALKHQGKLEKAYENAKKRINIRRDVHSIEEIVSVLFELMKSFRNIDLPKAINLAEEQFKLIEEGIQINPRHYPIILSKLKLFRFINDSGKAMQIGNDLFDDKNVPGIYRQLAFTEMVEILSEGELYETALEWINKVVESIENQNIKQRLLLIQMKIYADKFMIGRSNEEGENLIIREVVDYFLNESNGEYIDLLMAARIFDWIGEPFKALQSLSKLIKESPNKWRARQELVLFLYRLDLIEKALSAANGMVKFCPWRAESYDTLSFILNKAGDKKLSSEAKEKGKEIFKKEMSLFDLIRNKY